VRDLAVDTDLEACRWQGWSPETRDKAAQTATDYEFRSLIAHFSAAESTPAADEPPAFDAYEPHCTRHAAEVLAWLDERKDEHLALLLDVWQDATGQAATPATQTVVFAGGERVLCFEGNIRELQSWFEKQGAPKIVHDAKTVKVALARHGLELC